MKVRATRDGQYDSVRWRGPRKVGNDFLPGEVFIIADEPKHKEDVYRNGELTYKKDDPIAFSPFWMEKVPAQTRITNKSAGKPAARKPRLQQEDTKSKEVI